MHDVLSFDHLLLYYCV